MSLNQDKTFEITSKQKINDEKTLKKLTEVEKMKKAIKKGGFGEKIEELFNLPGNGMHSFRSYNFEKHKNLGRSLKKCKRFLNKFIENCEEEF